MQTIYLADYTPFPYRIEAVALTFHLDPQATRVKAQLQITPTQGGDLRLDGEGLQLIHCAVDGQTLDVTPDDSGLTLPAALLPQTSFTLDTEVEIAPATNTALEGLYMSKGMYSTQCEAQGFRKITFYPDRPDVMAPFEVRIHGADPVLLSNGNLIEARKGFAHWSDPWPKPAYLFALVAGDLRNHPGEFTTKSGRKVDLNIWVRPGDEDRCDWALTSLIASMKWDEEVYGREYDLDIFNIVAVDDFNMGAMENKGLNIFNSKAVLASATTATDADFIRIESIIAHEYFHNWTGNRITCRDWFQLCLKEGLTVFRDQQFTADLRSAPVKRIEDVLMLRARQFREDAGPLAHPVRPESFVEINNFYTATVYEKGAELIGMLRRLVGAEAYAKALDLYFDRHDGQACTIEDWLRVFEDTTGRDLSQFKLWYAQAGTPRLQVTEAFEGDTLTLTLTQSLAPTPDQPLKKPMLIPVALGLLDAQGHEVLPTTVLELSQPVETFQFSGLQARPVVSILRDFSAPVVLEHPQDDATRAFLLAHDTDAFNRWEAGRSLTKEVLLRLILQGTPAPDFWLKAMAATLCDPSLDPAFRALVLRLPSEDDMAQTLASLGHVPQPEQIHRARKALAESLARFLSKDLPALYESLATPGAYAPSPQATAKRALKDVVLGLITRLDQGKTAREAYASANNLTDQISALSWAIEGGDAQDLLQAFEDQWREDRLVLDKWFTLQVLHAAPQTMAQTVQSLTEHPLFDWKNPNRFRAVFGALPSNHAGFHHAGGDSYRLLADWLIKLDGANPQTAARMSTAFETAKRYDADRQALIADNLRRILATPDLSRDLTEMVTRMLG